MSVPGWLVLDVYVMMLAGMLLVFVIRKKQKTRQDHTFYVLLATVLVLLAGDLMSRCNADGLPGIRYVLSRVGNYIIFAGDPAGYIMTLNYIDSWINDDGKNSRSKTASRIIGIYAAANLTAVTVSETGNLGWFYSYPDGIYQRGPLYVPRGIMNMFFCLLICLYILLRRKEIRTEYTGCVIAFPLIVLVSGFLQVFIGGASYEYAGTIFACLLLYIVVQNRSIDMDYLTGLLNRRGIDEEMQYRLQHTSQPFAAYLLDLDFFKNINDDCGHESGDDALRAMAALLRKAFGRSAVIGRFGGDEFLIINDAADRKEAEKYIKDLENLCRYYNKDGKGRRGYQLGFSVGYDVYSAEKYPTLDVYIESLDQMMYSEKNRHHAIRN